MTAMMTRARRSLKYLQERSYKTSLKNEQKIIGKNTNNKHLGNKNSSSNFGERILYSKKKLYKCVH